MSYSRWSHSTWYTYWDCSSCDNPVLASRLNQNFTVCGDASFSYRELKEDINKCLEDCGPCTDDERTELKGYMLSFMKDVESEFSE